MSVYIRPCRGCPLRDGCEQREVFRRRMAGVGAASVRFNCDKLAAEIRIGRRVKIKHPVLTWGYEDYIIERITMTATINSTWLDYSFSAIIDAGMIESYAEDDGVMKADGTPMSAEEIHHTRFRRSQPYTRIVAFLDEPDWKQCKSHVLISPSGECQTHPESGCLCKQINLCDQGEEVIL